MSLPLSESLSNYNHVHTPVANLGASSNSPCSKLYSILKSDLSAVFPTVSTRNEDVMPFPMESLPKRSTKPLSNLGNGSEHCMWQCWQCRYIAEDDLTLAEHFKTCNCVPSGRSDLPGCPFCPKDGHHSSDWAFPTDWFNNHVTYYHKEISNLTCGYCLVDMTTSKLEELVYHMLSDHRIPWRPSPISLGYLRRDHLPHRVLTCMGCGWCTFVLRANNSVEPPSTLLGHVGRCPFHGGRVHLKKLATEVCSSVIAQSELITDCDNLTQSFAQTFPLVRGYPMDMPADLPKESNLHYRPSRDNIPVQANINPVTKKEIPDSTTPQKSVGRKFGAKKPRTKTPLPIGPKKTLSRTPNKRVKFDVPLTLPPVQGTSTKNVSKAPAPACLYVCPLCGDNALASLRERDEHLQAFHNGELVFPCQICGLAYPLYIALRRHAALKHNADYDTVRYGPADLLDSQPTECPACQLVAFTDREVLKLHLVEMHKVNPDRVDTLLRTHTRRLQNTSITGRSDGFSRRASRLSKGEANRPFKDRTFSARKNKVRSKTPSLSRLERILGQVSGEPAAASCRQCRTTVDNAKELRLHMELDHAETEEECEQLGCQACGRIFFGPGGRIDLIGHLRVLHQDADQSSALSCPHAEQKTVEQVAEDGTPIRIRPCEALFSSPRLRQIHSATSKSEHPGFSCPLVLELPDGDNQDALDLSEQLRAAIMETESAADREGLMILAYCCPNCSRLFAGFQAPMRFASHRLSCQLELRPVSDPPIPAPPVQPPENVEVRPASMTKLLESVLRQDPGVPIKR